MVKEKPRQYKAELESFKSFTHRVRDLVQLHICCALVLLDSVAHQIFVNLMRACTAFGNRPDDK